jgi:hypothetical protein
VFLRNHVPYGRNMVARRSSGSKLGAILAGPFLMRRIKDIVFQLRVQIQLRKDLLSYELLRAEISSALISGKQILTFW